MATVKTIRILSAASAGLCVAGLIGYGLTVARADSLHIVWPALCAVGSVALLVVSWNRAAALGRWLMAAFLAISGVGIAATAGWPVYRWNRSGWPEQGQDTTDVRDGEVEFFENLASPKESREAEARDVRRSREQGAQHEANELAAASHAADTAALVDAIISDFNALDSSELRHAYVSALFRDGKSTEIGLARRILAQTDDADLVAVLLSVLRDVTGKPLEADPVVFAASLPDDRWRILRSLDEWNWETRDLAESPSVAP